MRYHLDELVLIHVYICLKFCHSVLETVGFRVPAWHVRHFSLFSVCSSSKNCPFARCSSASNLLCMDGDVFGTKSVSLNHIL
jgi:hypothetical protein